MRAYPASASPPSQWGLRKFEQYDKREPDFTHTTGWWQIKGAGNEGLS